MLIFPAGEADPVLCHSPALGCAGLIVPGSDVLVTPKSSKADTKSKYSLDLVDVGPSIVGVNPMMCNKVRISPSEHFLFYSIPDGPDCPRARTSRGITCF